MCKIICVTNRKLCRGDFLKRIEEIAQCRPEGILLREKDLSAAEYTALAAQVIEICRRYDVSCILHSFPEAAMQLGVQQLHLPLPMLRTLPDEVHRQIAVIGTSCHSVQEAAEAASLDALYLIAGHIYDTDCKKGLPGRGLGFLREVCESRGLPVYAIGGITPERIPEVLAAGAQGVCIMSTLMQCEDVAAYFQQIRKMTE